MQWQKLLESCVCETNREKLERLVFDTEEAIFPRLREIATKPDPSDESHELKQAAQKLLELKIEKLGWPDPAAGLGMRVSPKNRVLTADDFSAFRQLLQQKLHENGFLNVVEAVDGLEAVAKAAEFQPDLILLDIAMPKLDGIKAAARIRAVAPQSKILFVSEITDPDVVQSALSDGARGYVCKSKLIHELLTAIAAVLGGGRFVSAGLCLS